MEDELDDQIGNQLDHGEGETSETSKDPSDHQGAYSGLGPDLILDAVDSLAKHLGGFSDGRLFALNSYENRVYQIGMEEGEPLIAKFYRPNRWSNDQIAEEHELSFALEEQEVPMVAPLQFGGRSLFEHSGFRFSLFQRKGGRPPELDNPDQLEQLGRFFGRIHTVGEAKAFKHRPTLDVQSFGVESYQYLLANNWLPKELEPAYRSLAEDLIKRIEAAYVRAGDLSLLRLHGDAHVGNILWRDESPHFVDLDDARMGPAIQDIWMFLSGDRAYMTARLADFLNGYLDFREFDPRELHLLEALRTLRMMHYAAWLARRWDDPAFPMAFPWFNTSRYWDEHILSLKEQQAMLDEPPLVWD